MRLLAAFIAANIAILLFNVVGMGIMTSQLNDFFAHKRDNLLGPPNWKVYAVMWIGAFLVAYLLIPKGLFE